MRRFSALLAFCTVLTGPAWAQQTPQLTPLSEAAAAYGV